MTCVNDELKIYKDEANYYLFYKQGTRLEAVTVFDEPEPTALPWLAGFHRGVRRITELTRIRVSFLTYEAYLEAGGSLDSSDLVCEEIA